MKKKSEKVALTQEQEKFIEKVLEGKNVLVDACCGSGKTTAIQELCNRIPDTKNILYLTYNKLLKIDAKRKIKNKNTMVTNYHGFAYYCCMQNNINVNKSDLIQAFLKYIKRIKHFDILVLDEYQDIDDEIAAMLLKIKEYCPNIQIVAVGDMKQKIYDRTHLDVYPFIKSYLGENFVELEFTQCFRLSEEYAKKLGTIWNKKIVGVNNDCKIRTLSKNAVIEFLSTQKPSSVLCLGARTGLMSKVLNDLEVLYPDIYNKKTVYASISDSDSFSKAEPNSKTAIFTTFDGSKGMERDICIVFDYTPDYWLVRAKQPDANTEILRNIFMVAASRGKKQIIFVKGDRDLLDDKYILDNMENISNYNKPFNASDMFDFKYKENIEECFNLLKCTPIETEDHTPINVKMNDALIDLSPCIGIYQEAIYFNNYNIDKSFELIRKTSEMKVKPAEQATMEEKVLLLTAASTKQERYVRQVALPFITKEQEDALKKRLSTIFSPDEEEQKEITILVEGKRNKKIIDFAITGLIDVYKNDMPYELKFVQELGHEHFLQLATYIIGSKAEKGILWNTYDNTMYEVTIPDKKLFLQTMVKCITKETVIPSMVRIVK